MARFKQEHADPETGWSDWIDPIMVGYKMACCDCHLVHDMEFKVFIAEQLEGRNFRVLKARVKGGRVSMRVKRNNRSTAALRRKIVTEPK